MKLHEFMKTANLSDAALAEQVSRDRSTVTRWRNGKSRPDYDALVALAKITKGKVTAADFLEAAQ